MTVEPSLEVGHPDTDRLPALPIRSALLGLLALSACAPVENAPRTQLRAHPEQVRALVASSIAAQFDPALAALRREAMAAPADLELQLRYASALSRAGQLAAAEAIVTAGLAHSPDHPGFLTELGRLRVRGGQAQVALALFDRVATLRPGADVEEGRGIALDLLGRHYEAQAAYRAAIAMAPERVSTQNNLAMSLLLTGQAREALALLEPLSRRQSAPARVNNNLAIARTMLGNEPQQDMFADARQVREAASNLRQTLGTGPAQPAPEGQFASAEPGDGAAVPLMPLDTQAQSSWAMAAMPTPATLAPASVQAIARPAIPAEIFTPAALPIERPAPFVAVQREAIPAELVWHAPTGAAPDILPVALTIQRPAVRNSAAVHHPRVPATLPPEIVTRVSLPVSQRAPSIGVEAGALPAARTSRLPSGMPPEVVVMRAALTTGTLSPAAGVERGALTPSLRARWLSQASGTEAALPGDMPVAGVPRDVARDAIAGLSPELAFGVPPEPVLRASTPEPARGRARVGRNPATTGLSTRLAAAMPPEDGVPGWAGPSNGRGWPQFARRAPEPAASAADAWNTQTQLAALPSASDRGAAVAASAEPSGSAGRGHSVQVAALTSAGAAWSYWWSLRLELPEAVGGRSPEIARAELPNGVFYRLRTGGFATAEDAQNFCTALRSRGRSCWVPGG